MERHALLHRIQQRRQLSRRMSPRPSLLTYVTGHNPLPSALDPRSSASAKQKYAGQPQESTLSTTIENNGRPQGSPPTTTPPPPLPYDAPPANWRVAASDTANDDSSADIVGAGVVDDAGRGPLRSPVASQIEDAEKEKREPIAPHNENVESELSRSPVVSQNDNRAGSRRLASPTFPRSNDETGHKPSQSTAVPKTNDGAGHKPSSIVPQHVGKNKNEHDNEQPQQSPAATIMETHGQPQGSPPTTLFDNGRPQGSPPTTTPPPPLPYDAPPANRRFAAHDTARDEDGADMVGAGVAEDGGRGPLRSPVAPPTDDAEPSRSPVVPHNEDGKPEKREPTKPTEVHQARPRRGRIEERPASTMSANLANPTTAQGQQTNSPALKKSDVVHHAKAPGKPEHPKTQAQIEAEALFQPKGENTNRTPQQWLAMLMNAGRGQQSTSDTQPEPARHDNASSIPDNEDTGRETHHTENAQAEPLSQQTRQFLRPLVGYDPANARVHRTVPAAGFAASHNAQAVTSGDDIALAAGHQSDTPETLGLLAHELTHVARQHTLGFTPPVANNARTDEEGVAEQVEQQAVRKARQNAKQPEHTNHANNTPKQSDNSSQWGGLPAPWEPLPDWLSSSPTAAETGGRGSDIDGHRATQPAKTDLDSRPVHTPNMSHGNRHAAHMPNMSSGTTGMKAVASNGHSGNSATSGNAGSVQRAGNERSMNITAQEVNEPLQGPQQDDTVQEPEPDLDELAQQVYAVLKRRLGVERRRMG